MKPLHYTIVALLALTLGLTSCSNGSVPVDLEDHVFDDRDDLDLGVEPWRARRRMDVDQLDRSIRAVTGGMGWERYRGDTNPPEQYFETFEDTLGVPDYINSSSEDLTVSLLFVKFLDDASRSVCRRMVDREAGEGPDREGPAQGIFAPVDLTAEDPPAETDVDQALSSLLLRFHGRRVEPSSEQLDAWRELYTTAAETADPPRRAWEGVCVALMTHPDFYTY